MRGAPPVTRVAAAFSVGAAFGRMPGPPLPALGVALLLTTLIDAWVRPDGRRLAVLLFTLAGVLSAGAGRTACAPPAEGARLELEGYFHAPTRGRGAPFRPVRRDRCTSADVYVLTGEEIAAGVPVAVGGVWREGRGGGIVVARTVTRDSAAGGGGRLVRWRGHLVERLDALYGPRAPVVAALVLARKEGLEREVREAFARSGTAHLLAISGFHVGVVAALVLTLVRGVGVRRRPAAAIAAGLTWGYVALLGFPDAACRAALILTAVALSRARGRPPARWGALGGALACLVVVDPSHLASPGFQLSFAGAAGLLAWSRPVSAWLARRSRRTLPAAFADALAAGACATLATLPIVAWHFERVSLVGIPATLVASPLVALLLPGALASLVADALHPAAGAFLAGGVDWGLWLLEALVRRLAEPAWASVWLPRTWLPVFVLGALVGGRLAAHAGDRGRRRWGAAALVGCASIVAWPVLATLAGRGSVEIAVLDVGQGDAIGIRSPRGRWVLVDAGPPVDGAAVVHPALAALRRRGVGRLEALVLTHPDLDHFGGAADILGALPVGVVMDPGRGEGKSGFVDVLETAVARGVPWRAARSGQRLELDGLTIDVLYPDSAALVAPEDANATSVVLLVRYGAFEALLTGDAPVATERAILGGLPERLEVLKVGHHGSGTSTSPELLERTGAQLALVSVGRGNRYGHPTPSVVGRLRSFGVEVHRTDREGTVRVIGRRDGSFRTESERARHR